MRFFCLCLSVLLLACNSNKATKPTSESTLEISDPKGPMIANYHTDVFEDSKGQLWFGSVESGLAMYNGEELRRFTLEDGLPSMRVTSIIEAEDGAYWLLTGEGICSYDGHKFSSHPVAEDWQSNNISTAFVDSKGKLWLGTWGGVYLFDDDKFEAFDLPIPEVQTRINQDTKSWITSISEDGDGNMWFSRDNYGVCVYDGTAFRHILKKDGLLSNNVMAIEFDLEGNVWFGSRVAEKDLPNPDERFGSGGLNVLRDGKMESFPLLRAFNREDVYDIHLAPNGEIWVSSTTDGVYRYDGEYFSNFNTPVAIMSVSNDRQGNMWLGGAGGLYKINSEGELIEVRENGPWD